MANPSKRFTCASVTRLGKYRRSRYLNVSYK